MRLRKAPVWTALVVVGVVGAASPSAAQGGPGAAQKTFIEGKKAFAKKDYEQALALFTEAHRATGSPNAHLLMARCLRQMGRLPEAYEAMSATHREASKASATDKKYAKTRDAAFAELSELAGQVGKVVVLVTGDTETLEVRVGERSISTDQLGSEVAVEPGEVVVHVTGSSMEPVRRTVQVRVGETKTVALDLRTTEGQSATPTGEMTPQPSPDGDTGEPQSKGPWKTVGYTALGVGGAGLIVFTVAGLMARSRFNEVEEACGGVRCTDMSYAEEIDGGKRMQTISNVGLAVGIVGLAGGAAALFFTGSDDEPKAGSEGVSLGLGPGGAGVNYRTTF